MGKTLKDFEDWTLKENLMDYNIHYRNCKRIVKGRFHYKNLPDGIPEKYIEEVLFRDGMICFYKEGGFIKCAPCTEEGINSYGDGTSFRPITEDGQEGEELSTSECVVIYNTSMKEPSSYICVHFAKRLSGIENAINVNIETLKIPYLVSCSESQKQTAIAAIQSRQNGEPVIFVNEDFEELNSFKIWTLDGQKSYLAELEQEKIAIKNEFLSFFGINNTNIQKRERLTSGENEQNNEEIQDAFKDFLNERLDGFKKVNEKFGCNIVVECDKGGEEDFTQETDVDNS